MSNQTRPVNLYGKAFGTNPRISATKSAFHLRPFRKGFRPIAHALRPKPLASTVSEAYRRFHASRRSYIRHRPARVGRPPSTRRLRLHQSELFSTTDAVWPVHLSFQPDQWKAIEPSDSGRPFGGPGGPVEGRAASSPICFAGRSERSFQADFVAISKSGSPPGIP